MTPNKTCAKKWFLVAIGFAVPLVINLSACSKKVEVPAPAHAPASSFWERGRDYFFTISPELVKARPSVEAPQVFGVIMDWHMATPNKPVSSVVLTAIAVADGTSSVYTSNDDVTIMGGYAASQAAKEVVSLAELHLHSAIPVSSHPPPPVSSVRFYIRTYSDLRVIEASEKDLQSGNSSYSALFHAANRIVSELLRAADEQGARGRAILPRND